ncbi:MAG: RICIN domain-containing protein [Deltaproteobacteria bacterium]|nr:RICIN domain-containing protein [Deltaproteobacteria bacterium]
MKIQAFAFALALAPTLVVSCVDQDDLDLDTTEAEVTATAGTTYQLVNGGGRCMDVPGFTRASGLALQSHPCKTAGYLGNQQFTLEAVTGGYRVRGFDSQLCLDLPNGSTADGTIVQQYQCHAGQNQIWALQDETYGHVRLTTALDASKCIYVDAANAVRLSRCTTVSASARNWAFGLTRTHASFRQAGQCLDLAGHTTTSGASPQLGGCKTTDTLNQEWALEPVAGGTFRLRSMHSLKCLDLRAGSLADGTVVEQQSCTTMNAQKWTLLSQTASTYKLQNVASGKCADFYGGALRTWTCSTSFPSQLFEVQAGLSGTASMLSTGATQPVPVTGPQGLWAVDSALVPPVVTGQIMHNAIVVTWSVNDPRIVGQRVMVWEEVPGVQGGPGPQEFAIPATQRAFWVGGFANRSLIAGRRYTVTVMTMSQAGVSSSTPTTFVAGVLPSATMRVGIQPGNQTITPTVVDPIAFFDANGNGIVDGAPAGNGTFPRFPAASGSSSISAIGNRFATQNGVRANVIVGFTLLEGSRRTFAAVHLFVNPATGAGTVTGAFYGDLDAIIGGNVWSGSSATGDLDVLQGNGAVTPNIAIGAITAQAMANDGSFRVIDFQFLLALIPA